MGNAITSDARAMWLMLRNDGGWWTAKNLTHHWRPTFAEWEVNDMLNALVAGGFIEKRTQDLFITYGITSTCAALPGLSLAREAQP